MASVEHINSLGGEDIKIHEQPEKTYCDKPNHFLRSIFHQSNHSKHSVDILGPILEEPRNETMSRIPMEWFRGHLPIIRSRNQK